MKKVKKAISFLLVFATTFIFVSCDRTLYEVDETKVTHTVTLQSDDWVKVITVKNGEYYNFPEPSKEHYILSGWTNGEYIIKSSGVWNFIGDVVLNPVWSPKKYSISYELNINGVTTNKIEHGTYTIEDTVSLDNPFYNGYMFMGWTGEDIEEMTKVVTINEGSYGDKTYVANWLQIQFYGFQYRLIGDEAVVIGYYPYEEIQSKEEILSEVEYEGKKYPVIGIADEAFSNMGAFAERVIIPESIVYIGKNAFYNCDDLEICLPNDANVEQWSENVVIEEGNKDVKDVILGLRPKIGWSKYV